MKQRVDRAEITTTTEATSSEHKHILSAEFIILMKVAALKATYSQGEENYDDAEGTTTRPAFFGADK